MTIKALCTDTRRLIGSTSLVASPVCLVRELVDNAIDARASCVDILISRNTVDKVEVRDNGSGITKADFDALGRLSHSSKTVSSGTGVSGSPSLGFRGQGLASVNNIGYVAFTTRTSDDAIASTFRLVPNVGGVAPGSQKVSSAPWGTTVSVTCVFSTLPVRRKVTVQDSGKTITVIKTVLSSYALARPNLRISLRILQPQGAPLNSAETKITAPWDYRPTTVGIGRCVSLKQAVSALFGAEVARQCQETVATAKELLGNQSTLSQALSQGFSERSEQAEYNGYGKDGELSDFIFEAWLPEPGANLAKVKLGSFISVDGRPVSSGLYGSIGKKLSSIFTAAFGKSLTVLQQYEGDGSPVTPVPQSKLNGLFIRLNIKCPPGSYDANVDSSKTDVLFADERLVCDAFERLCKKVYKAGEPMVFRQPSRGSQFIPRTPQRPQMPSPFSRPTASLESSQETPMGRPLMHGSSRLSSGRPIEGTPTPASRVQAHADEDNFPVRIQISSHAGNRRRLISAPRARATRSFHTPPASPLRASRGRMNRMPINHSPGYPDLPGLVSRDGFRQTTIAFNNPPARKDRQLQGDEFCQREMENNREITNETEQGPVDFGAARNAGGTGAGEGSSFGTGSSSGIAMSAARSSFVSARELCATEQQASAGPSRPRLPPRSQFQSQLQGAVQPHGLLSRAAQSTQSARSKTRTSDGQSTEPSGGLVSAGGRPARVMRVDMRVDIQRLRHSAVQFTRTMRSWNADEKERGGDYLSPEMADIASLETRLRAVVAAWIAKKRVEKRGIVAGDGDEEPIKVELYLRKSLKQKALMVHNSHE